MKSAIRIISVIISIILLASVTVYAADSYITMNGFEFYTKGKGEAVIHKYTGDSKNVEIPLALMGARVTEIEDYAFFNNTEIESVSFEDAEELRKIGLNAFYGCSELTEVDIPSWVTEISFGTFQNCTSLEKVTIGEGITSIPSQCFLGCGKLNDIVIPDSVTSIAENSFKSSPNVVIYCNEGSYAKTYAESKDVDLILIRDYELGDANLDGEVDILDVTIIQKYKAGMLELPYYHEKTFADVSKDGKVTVRDATLIQMKLAGMTDF